MLNALRGKAALQGNLKVFAEELSAAPRLVDDIARLTSDNPLQRANVARMREGLRQKLAASQLSNGLAANGRAAEAVNVFYAELDAKPMATFRRLSLDMLKEEQRLMRLRQERLHGNVVQLLAVVLAAAAVLALLSLGAAVVVRRYGRDLARSEDALRGLNDELEARVRRRTADLSRANEEIQRFAYIVSHDLRSPLVNVMGFTSELEVGLKPVQAVLRALPDREDDRTLADARVAVEGDMPEAIGFIRTSTRKMDSLINAILRLSREGRRTLAPEPLDMDVLAQSLIDGQRHQLDSRGAVAEVEGSLPPLVNDRLAIEQLFGNLLDNAVKYLQPGRPGHIVLRGRVAGAQAIYEVQDNGRGVDPKDHERIFELFRRAGAQDQVGEGLGLAHVRALTHRLGGAITCLSALDQGALFRVSLPLVLKPGRDA